MQQEHEKPTHKEPASIVTVICLLTLGWALVYLGLYLFGT